MGKSIKDSKQFFIYFSTNKKQKSSICPLNEEGANHFSSVFTSQNFNNDPDFNLSYRKKIEAPMTYFRINEQLISKCIKNLKLSKCPEPDEISPRNLKMERLKIWVRFEPNI